MSKAYYCIYLSTPLNEAPLLRTLREYKVECDFYSPKYRGEKKMKKKMKPILRPVFSTYAFLYCDYTPQLSKIVQGVTGCYFVPGVGEDVTAIDEEEMTQFKANIKEYTTAGTVEGKQIVMNTQVEVISGSLAGYTVTVKAIVKGVVLAEMNIFGRSVPVTLKASEISGI